MKIDPSVRSRLRKKLIQELKNPSQRVVTVKTAVELSSDQLENVKKAVPQLESAELHNEVDSSIVGGMVIVDGSKIIDLSIKGSLQDLMTTLM